MNQNQNIERMLVDFMTLYISLFNPNSIQNIQERITTAARAKVLGENLSQLTAENGKYPDGSIYGIVFFCTHEVSESLRHLHGFDSSGADAVAMCCVDYLMFILSRKAPMVGLDICLTEEDCNARRYEVKRGEEHVGVVCFYNIGSHINQGAIRSVVFYLERSSETIDIIRQDDGMLLADGHYIFNSIPSRFFSFFQER